MLLTAQCNKYILAGTDACFPKTTILANMMRQDTHMTMQGGWKDNLVDSHDHARGLTSPVMHKAVREGICQAQWQKVWWWAFCGSRQTICLPPHRM